MAHVTRSFAVLYIGKISRKVTFYFLFISKSLQIQPTYLVIMIIFWKKAVVLLVGFLNVRMMDL